MKKSTAFAVLAIPVVVSATTVNVTVGPDELPFVRPSESVRRLRAEIAGDGGTKGEIAFELVSLFGEKRAVTHGFETAADGKASVQVLEQPLSKGTWDVNWSLTAGGERAKGTKRIAVFEPNGPSAGLNGEFTFGCHAHLQCCHSEAEMENEVRAAAMTGFRLMRIDIAWRDVERTEGVYTWTTPDRRLALLDKYGMKAQVLIGLAPDFAAKKDWKYLVPGRGPCGNILPDPTRFEKFMADFAARYRGRVPFYELYNEPDLIGFGNFSRDEYVESFKAGARGIRAADPAAKVMTGGFACWRITMDTKPDFYPRAVTDCAADFDVLAIHEHGGPPDGFFKVIDNHWLPTLRSCGAGKKPIYTNETAEDRCRSEQAQAACYFQKMLFTWSRGGIAHNWYKIRENNADELFTGNSGYGMMSRDWKTAAVLPCAAATISLFRDAHYERDVSNEDMRLLVFSKKGSLMVAGWQHRPGTPVVRPVAFRTDASGASFVDMAGNVHPLELKRGSVVFDPGRLVGTLVLRHATKAEAVANPSLPKTKGARIRVPEGDFPTKPQIVLDRPEQYVSDAGFNPATAHLMWTGPEDLSARVYLARKDGMLRIRVDVTDDVFRPSPHPDAPNVGDAVCFLFLKPSGHQHVWTKTRTAEGRYEWGCPLKALEFAEDSLIRFNVLVTDNDEGKVCEGMIKLVDDWAGERRDEWAELTF